VARGDPQTEGWRVVEVRSGNEPDRRSRETDRATPGRTGGVRRTSAPDSLQTCQLARWSAL